MSGLLAMPELLLAVRMPELLAVAMPEQMCPFLLAMPELLLVVEASQHPPPMYSPRQVSSEGGGASRQEGPS